MTSALATLPLSEQGDPTEWMSGVLVGWGLPGGLARTWAPAVRPALAEAAELVLEHDADLGLVTVEARDAAGRVLVGLDDFVGPAAGA